MAKRLCCTLLALVSIACDSRAQEPLTQPDLNNQLFALQRSIAAEQQDPHSDTNAHQIAFLRRFGDLRRQVVLASPSWSSAEIGACHDTMVSCAASLKIEGGRILADLENARRQILALPKPHHGMSLILRRISDIRHDDGRSPALTEWGELIENWPNVPKKGWLAAEAGRRLINQGRVPGLAVDALDAGIRAISALPDWSHATCQELIADADLWITLPERPLAGTRTDCLGQLFLLRGFAMLQLQKLSLALDNLATARGYLEQTANEHRLTNVRHNLAGVWLQLGRMDETLAVAEAACKSYELSTWAAGGLPDWNGVYAMRKVQARALAQRNQPGDLARARALLAQMGANNLAVLIRETNADAAIAWAEVLLAGDMPEPDVDLLNTTLDALHAYCERTGEQALLAEADLVESSWLIRSGHPQTALARLAATEARIQDRVQLRIRHACIRGNALLATGMAHESLSSFLTAGRLVRVAIDQERLWSFDFAIGTFQQLYSDALSGAVRAYQTIHEESPNQASEPLQDLYEIVQQFHCYEAACLSLTEAQDLIAVPHETRERYRLLGERATLLRNQIATKQRTSTQRGFPAMLHQEALRSTQRELTKTTDEIGSLSARLRSNSVAPDPASLAEVMSSLLPGETLLECINLEEGVYAICVNDTSAKLRLLANGPELREAVQEFEAWVAEESSATDPHAVPALNRLSHALLSSDGWLDAMLARTETLHWSPEGPLCRIPIAALPWRNKLVGDQVAVVHQASGTLLARSRNREQQPLDLDASNLLALGNPRYSSAAIAHSSSRGVFDVNRLQPLPASAREILAIARLFAHASELGQLDLPDAKTWSGQLAGDRFQLLLGKEARESALLEADLSKVQFLHLACHAYADLQAPSLSFLAFALGNSETNPDEGLLRLSEFTKLRGDYQLMALSACETGKGPIRGHEGPASLARAAYAAGARRVLASLWQVGDQHAADLVTRFYRAWLVDGLTAAGALRAAQQQVRQTMPIREWAAFALWGEPR